jgi:soluble lytic murein transglycosylase-like protein
MLRSARPQGFRSSGYSAKLAFRLFFCKARRASAVALALSLGAFGAGCAEMQAPVTQAPVAREASSPRAACLVAARQAEITHGVPEGLLTAIALNESGLHAYALNLRGRAHFPETREEARRLLTSAGTRGMAGCFQINAGVHVTRGEDWPLDPNRAADWAARYLVRHYERHGDWGSAVLRWHGASPRRAGTQIICRVHSKLEVTAPGSTLFNDRCRTGAPQWARVRRNGASLLEVAEAAE